MRIEIDGHAYAGPLREWGEDLALMLRTLEPVMSDDDALTKAASGLASGAYADALPVLRQTLAAAPELVLEWLDGWTRDGEPCTPSTLRGLGWEPVVAAAHVVRAHGFFSPSSGLLESAAALWPEAMETARDLASRAGGASESGDDTD